MVDDEHQSWRALISPGRRGTVAVLTSGVLLFAVDAYVTASLLPSAVAEIGGERFYAWVTTVFLLTAVVSSTLVSRVLARTAPRRAYLGALVAFGVGALGAVLAPSMAVLLVARAVQGIGGGLLAGMAYVLVRWVLPASLWTRASALISTMWGLGLLVGPALGGVLAEIGLWRGAFGVLTLATAGVAVLVPAALPAASSGSGGLGGGAGAEPGAGADHRLPVVSVLLVGGAATVVSVTGLAGRPVLAAVGVVLGAVGVVAFLWHERSSRAGVLPSSVFRPGSPLRSIYLCNAVFSAVATVEAWVPLFGQRLGGLSPLVAGFLGAALSAGWVAGEVRSAGGVRRRPARLVLAGSVLVVGGLVLVTLTWAGGAAAATVGVWAAGLAVTGVGIGTAWPHLAAGAMGGWGGSSTPDEGADGDRASAAITIVQMLATTLGASLTGVAATLGEPDTVVSARLLFGMFAVLALLGVAGALGCVRTSGRRRDLTDA